MDVKAPENVPYIVFEGELARQERHIKRLWIALIVAIAIIFVCNAIWLYVWNQYEYVSESVTVDAENGVANYVGNDGDIYNGQDYSTAFGETQESGRQ